MTPYLKHYILDHNREPQAVDLFTWAYWLGNGDDGIVGQEMVGRFWVSTVFTGMDSDWLSRLLMEESGGVPLGFYEPLAFETMVFMNKAEDVDFSGTGYKTRARSWVEAEAQHARAIKIMTRYERMLAHRERVLKKIEGSL